jgi:ribosomal protein S18 acetylase RimI-like enzyme
MVEIRAVAADGWQALRDVRLAALQEAPRAFAATYEREAALAETEWQRRITGSGNFLAYEPQLGAAPVGIAAGFEAGPETVELVSLWVAPRARGRGIGEALVCAVVGWARANGASRVHLWVTESNDNARRLYQRCGFWPTAERQSLPSDPDLTEVGMARSPRS